MVIQFNCPSCRQPIEVDNEWGGRHVNCPFCERVVTAPTMSTLSEKELAGAEQARQLSDTPEPAHPLRASQARRGRMPFKYLGVFGLGLSLLSIVLFIIVNIVTTSIVYEELGPDITPEDAQEKLVEVLMAPEAGSTRLFIMCGSCLSFCCWVAGLCLSIFALVVKSSSRRGMATAAIICSGVLPFLLLLSLLVSL